MNAREWFEGRFQSVDAQGFTLAVQFTLASPHWMASLRREPSSRWTEPVNIVGRGRDPEEAFEALRNQLALKGWPD